MAKYKYSANVELIRGNISNGMKMNFVANENVFKGNYDIKQLDRIALRYVKKQHKEKISEYEKVIVRGFEKLEIIPNQIKNYPTKRSYSKTRKKGGKSGLFSKVLNLLEKILK